MTQKYMPYHISWLLSLEQPLSTFSSPINAAPFNQHEKVALHRSLIRPPPYHRPFLDAKSRAGALLTPAVCFFTSGLHAHGPQPSQLAPQQLPELPVSHEAVLPWMQLLEPCPAPLGSFQWQGWESPVLLPFVQHTPLGEGLPV